MNNQLISFKKVRPYLTSCAFFMAQILFVVGVLFVGSQTALAYDDPYAGLYPYADYSIANNSSINPSTWCQPGGCTYNSNDEVTGGWASEYSYGYRNCTDYVAWRLSKNGITIGNWRSAWQWEDAAFKAGYKKIDTIPGKGAIAYWESNNNPGKNYHPVGHVGYVLDWDPVKNTVKIADFNYDGKGNYDERTYDLYLSHAENDKPDKYIHVEAGRSTILGGWWIAPTPDDNSKAIPGTLLNFKAHGIEPVNNALDKINLTFYQPGQGWQILNKITFPANTAEGDVSGSYVMPDVPYAMFSFDIYGRNGTYQQAPNGVRKICNALDTATCIHNDGDGGLVNLFGLGGGTGQPLFTCAPGANQAAVFTEKDYQGNCMVKDLGEYLSPETIGLPNDSISSIKVGGGVNVRFCDNAGLNSPCEYFSADDSDLSNNSLGDNTVSSMKVEGGAPTTGCVPGETQVAFFVDPNYSGTCIVKGIGTYNDPSAINLPNDSISSIKVGAKAKVRVCNDAGMNSPCEYFDYDDADLSNNSIGDNTISSAGIEFRGGIALCDGTNYGGPCKWFGTGKYNMQDQGFNDIAESVQFDANWANRYHIVLWTEANQTGNPYHADNSVADLGTSFRNHVRSIEIYMHTPPNASIVSPVNGAVLPANTTSVMLNYNGGSEKHVHIWSSSYDVASPWASSDSYTATGLTPGTYSWQVQGRNEMGDGPWSAVSIFTINTPPVVWGGNLTVGAGTSQIIQIQASDADGNPITLSAANFPSFATFTDNHNGIAVLSLAPQTANVGQYAITVTASDGDATGTGVINVSVVPSQPDYSQGFQGEYFNNMDLSGTPTLTRMDPAINFDWGFESPDALVPEDNFSARWTRIENFSAGTYKFSATGDDGIRLFVDGVKILDKWIDQGATTYNVSKDLSEGNHTIVYEYYENSGDAVAKLSYQQAPAAPPAAPSDLIATPLNSTSIGLSWKDNSDNETGFEISNGNTTVNVGANTTTYTWSGLTPGKYMCFHARSYNSAGSSAYTGYSCTTTPNAPLAPIGLSVSAVNGTSIRMSWYDMSSDETGFEISNGETSVKVGANITSYIWGGLTPGKYMCFQVRSFNDVGSSKYTSYRCATTPTTLPIAPSDLIATPLNSTSIGLSWKDNSDNETGFEISNGDTSVKVGANLTSYTWGGLTPGKYMCFSIRSYNAGGSSAYTAYSCATTLTTPPIAPSNVSVTNPTASSLRVNFTDNATDETNILVERKTGTGGSYVSFGGFGALTGTSSWYWINTGLSSKTTYCYRLKAVNASGSSAYSNEACGTTL